jgi:hypothetical protein
VREALARLAAERFIDFAARHGYSIPVLSAEALRSLYAWSGQLIHLSLEDVSEAWALPPGAADRLPWRSSRATEGAIYAREVSILLFEIARSHPNQEFADRIAQTNDRLYRARLCEPAVFADAQGVVCELKALWRQSSLALLPEKFASYHQARVDRAEEICVALARSWRQGPEPGG